MAAATCGVLVPVAGWMMLIIGHYLFIYLYPTQISSGHTDRRSKAGAVIVDTRATEISSQTRSLKSKSLTEPRRPHASSQCFVQSRVLTDKYLPLDIYWCQENGTRNQVVYLLNNMKGQ